MKGALLHLSDLFDVSVVIADYHHCSSYLHLSDQYHSLDLCLAGVVVSV